MATAPVSKAAKRPNKTMRFLADIKEAIDLFDDEISSHGDPRAMAYEHFISSYKSAFAHIWPKIETADVKVVLQSVKDKELKELRRMTEVISSDSSRPTLVTEDRSVPVLEQILGSMVSRLPNQKPPDKDTCKLISMIFSDLADAHKHLANASRGIADIATLIALEQLTLILAAAVPPTLQLVLPPDLVSPLSTPPPPPNPATTVLGKIEMVKYCKTRILPTPTDEAFLKYEEKSPVRVLAAAVFSTLEKHLFDETTARADIANTFHITSAQLHKAVTGVDYRSGPHVYKRKRKTTTAPTASGETPKPTSAPSSAPSPAKETQKTDEISEDSGQDPTAEELHSADTLPTDSSDSLPDVPFK